MRAARGPWHRQRSQPPQRSFAGAFCGQRRRRKQTGTAAAAPVYHTLTEIRTAEVAPAGLNRHASRYRGVDMPGPSHADKRRILERHFLLGKLSPAEIDALVTYSRLE